MKNEDVVSVIIPTYKRPKELERAIISVKNQTYKNIEIIVVDDNANDIEQRKSTEQVVKKYENIVYIQNKENLGGSKTRNIGIENAKGKYIAFLDDDDEFLPNKIEQQIKLYKEYEEKGEKIGLVYCYAKIINDNEKITYQKKNYEGVPIFEHMKECIAATSWWFSTKEVFETIGKFDDISSHQDALLLLKMLKKGYKIYRVPEILLNYYNVSSNNRISGINEKNIKVTEAYRNICRESYDLLEQSQIKQLEHTFSYKLAIYYAIMENREKEIKELKNALKNSSSMLKNIKLMIRIMQGHIQKKFN